MADLSATERILAVVRAIPRGQVVSYGEVARRAGLPGRARLVARVLGIGGGGPEAELPWHRVLRSDGRIGLPPGTEGWCEQVRRLRAEGVSVERGRLCRPLAAISLDRWLWGPRVP